MRKALFITAAMMMAVLTTSCSKDDGGNGDGDKKKVDNTYTGTLNVTQADQSVFTLNDIEVQITRTDDHTLEMKMFRVKFSNRMPVTLDMTVPGIGYAVSGNGYSMSGDNIVPLAMGGEFPAYTITGITGSLTGNTVSFSFTCGGTYPLTYSGNVKQQ